MMMPHTAAAVAVNDILGSYMRHCILSLLCYLLLFHFRHQGACLSSDFSARMPWYPLARFSYYMIYDYTGKRYFEINQFGFRPTKESSKTTQGYFRKIWGGYLHLNRQRINPQQGLLYPQGGVATHLQKPHSNRSRTRRTAV